MKLKIKIRLSMLRDRISNFFTPKLREAIKTTFYVLLLLAFWTVVPTLGYIAGYANGVDAMSHKYETDIPMCATKNTEIRENPTGFVLSDIHRGDVVWVVQLQVPFAVVWYFNGTDWNLGTTTASYLMPCE